MALSSTYAESSYYNEDDDGTSVFSQLPEYASGVGTIDTVRNPPTYISRMDATGGPSRLGRRGSRSSFYPAQTLGTPYEYTLPIPKPKDATSEKKKKPWLTWKIADPRRSTNPPKFPTFVGGQNVTGEVVLDLDGSVKITSISLRLTGMVITMGQLTRVTSLPAFLNIACNIWPPAEGEDVKSKPTGEFEVQFDFPFPQDVVISNVGAKEKMELTGGSDSTRYFTPPTLREPQASVHYKLELIVGHGTFRSDSKLSTPVVFVPHTSPDEPSVLRQKAYSQEVPPPFPSKDPAGWFSLPEVHARGFITEGRVPVEVAYKLSLARPSAYTRGTSIPCHLSIRTDKPSYIPQMTVPTEQVVRLFRRINVVEGYDEVARYWAQQLTKIAYEDAVAKCRFWAGQTAKEQGVSVDAQGWGSWELQGEIYLERTLIPTFHFAMMTVEYFVQLLPCASSAFKVCDFEVAPGPTDPPRNPKRPKACTTPLPESTVLSSESVSVTTVRAPGARQVLYCPPDDSQLEGPSGQRTTHIEEIEDLEDHGDDASSERTLSRPASRGSIGGKEARRSRSFLGL